MKKENKFYTAALIFSCLLLILSVIGVGKVVVSHSVNGMYLVGAIFVLVSLIFALYYISYGYSKNLALLYKTSIALATINALIVTAVSVNEDMEYLPIIFCTLCFGLYMVLLFAEDLGKTKSYVFASLIVIIRASGLISNVIAFKSITNDYVILVVAQLALAIMVLVSISAKYIDKTNRNTK